MRAWRAAGVRPKLTFESPTMVPTPGSSLFILRMPSMVSIPSRRLSSMPVVIGSTSGIEEQVLRGQPVAVDGQVVDGPGRPQLPFRRAGLALGVDAGADHGRAVLPGQRQEAVEPGARRRRRPRG